MYDGLISVLFRIVSQSEWLLQITYSLGMEKSENLQKFATELLQHLKHKEGFENPLSSSIPQMANTSPYQSFVVVPTNTMAKLLQTSPQHFPQGNVYLHPQQQMIQNQAFQNYPAQEGYRMPGSPPNQLPQQQYFQNPVS